MTRWLNRTIRCVFVVALILLIVASVAEARRHHSARPSIVALLAPAHGSAFAYGATGQLLTTATAVGQARSVQVVNAAGTAETVSVVPTSDPAIVQLRGTVLTPPTLTGAASGAHGRRISIVPGPLNPFRSPSGTLLGTTGRTTITARSVYDGSPVLDRRGDVIGAAGVTGKTVVVLFTAGLEAEPRHFAQSSTSLLPLLLALVAVGIGIGIARLLVRQRVRSRLEERRMGRATAMQNAGGFARAGSLARTGREVESAYRPGDDEPDTEIQVVLRPKPPEEPLPDVQLRRRDLDPPGGS